jgi:tetratricopeptide (TPR) repeat protein
LQGFDGEPFDLSFSPDGTRLASFTTRWSSFDPQLRRAEVQLWNVTTGQEVLRLDGGVGMGRSLFFAQGGDQLMAAVRHPDQSFLKVWDATPMPSRCEAYDLVSRWLDKAPNVNWSRDEVLDRIKTSRSLPEDVSLAAYAIAASWPVTADSLEREAWEIMRVRNNSREAYRQALDYIERAVRIAPESWPLLNTLGVAQFRSGKYADAKRSMEHALELSVDATNKAANYIFLAMTCHQLKERENAHRYLDSCRALLTNPDIARQPEYRRFFQEAEEMLRTQ